MTTILWDHVRRWWWLWLPSGLIYGFMVWSGVPDRSDWTVAFFPIAMYLGIIQLSQDLSRGNVPRVLRTLPVTGKQIGRAWWWASVGLPVLMLAVITGLVFWFSAHINHAPVVAGRPPYVLLFGLFSAYYSHEPVSGAGCFYFWLSNALLFGPLFLFFSGTPAPGIKGWVTGRGTRGRGCLFSLFFAASFFSMLWFYRLFPPHTTRWEIFIATAALLTIASWFGTEAFARERLGSLPTNAAKTRLEALAGEDAQKRLESFVETHAGFRDGFALGAKGPGGLRFLFQTIFYPLLGLGFSMVMFSSLLVFPFLTVQSQGAFASAFWPTQSLFLWFASLLVMPRVLLQIRWLRTLPVSTAQLTGVFLFAPVTAMLAFMGLSNLILGIIHPIPQLSFMSMLHQGCFLQIALTTLLVPLILWRGLDALVLAVVLLLAVGSGVGSLYLQKHFAFMTNIALALLLVLASWLLSQFLLQCSHTYRPRPGQTGGWFWGARNG